MTWLKNYFMNHKQTILFFAIFLVAIAFIVIGLDRGGFYDTMAKAIRICLECIGIG